MSGITPEPAGPASSTPDGLAHDGLARLKLAQALKRARLAIAWERGWPHLARLLTVVASCGMVSLELLQTLYNAKFELLGINADMLVLRREL